MLSRTSEALQLVKAAAWSTHQCSQTESLKLRSSAGGRPVKFAEGHGEHDEVDVLFLAEPHQLIGRQIGSQMMYVPVVLAQRCCGQRRGQDMSVARKRRYSRGATAPATRIGVVLSEDPINDRRGAMLD